MVNVTHGTDTAAGLAAAGTASAVTSVGATGSDLMGWLNGNAEGLGIIIGVITCIATISFFSASIYLRRKEVSSNRKAVVAELRFKYLTEIEEKNIPDSEKQAAAQVVNSLLDRRG